MKFLLVQNRQQTHDWTLIGSGTNGFGLLEWALFTFNYVVLILSMIQENLFCYILEIHNIFALLWEELWMINENLLDSILCEIYFSLPWQCLCYKISWHELNINAFS